MAAVPITEGEIPFDVAEAGRQCSTFYKVLGELGLGPTLIALHGVSPLRSWEHHHWDGTLDDDTC